MYALIQGHYRAAKAAMKLREYQEAITVIEKGLAADINLPELRQMLPVAQQKVQDMAAARQREAAKAMAERAPAKRLAAELLKRQYKIGRPQLSLGQALHLCFAHGLQDWLIHQIQRTNRHTYHRCFD